MTEPEPISRGPRFPCVQLVFCLACLGMAAYTWMKYSYAWGMSPSEFWRAAKPSAGLHDDPVVGPYVAVAGKVLDIFSNNSPPFGYRSVNYVLDATFSRWTGASVAGLAVGAMVRFIFGLQLRRRLGERRALAREPGRDMIARPERADGIGDADPLTRGRSAGRI